MKWFRLRGVWCLTSETPRHRHRPRHYAATALHLHTGMFVRTICRRAPISYPPRQNRTSSGTAAKSHPRNKKFRNSTWQKPTSVPKHSSFLHTHGFLRPTVRFESGALACGCASVEKTGASTSRWLICMQSSSWHSSHCRLKHFREHKITLWWVEGGASLLAEVGYTDKEKYELDVS